MLRTGWTEVVALVAAFDVAAGRVTGFLGPNGAGKPGTGL